VSEIDSLLYMRVGMYMSSSSEYQTLLDIENKHVLSNRITGTRTRPHIHTHTHTLNQSSRKRLMCVYRIKILCCVLFMRPEDLVWFLFDSFYVHLFVNVTEFL